jgi:hypothetical protein
VEDIGLCDSKDAGDGGSFVSLWIGVAVFDFPVAIEADAGSRRCLHLRKPMLSTKHPKAIRLPARPSLHGSDSSAICTTVSKTIFCSMQTIAGIDVAGYLLLVTYGERFRELRKLYWKKPIVKLAQALGSDHSATVYNIEKQWRPPKLATIARHAKAIGCEPWELLRDVETEFDLAKKLIDVEKTQAARQWAALVAKVQESSSRSGQTRKEPLPIESPRSMATDLFRGAAKKR